MGDYFVNRLEKTDKELTKSLGQLGAYIELLEEQCTERPDLVTGFAYCFVDVMQKILKYTEAAIAYRTNIKPELTLVGNPEGGTIYERHR